MKVIRDDKICSLISRRHNISKWCEAEAAIGRAMMEVEKMPADKRLTKAVTLLSEAKDKVSDYIDNI